MNTVSKVGDELVCTCGARSGKSGHRRFEQRHPKLCSDRRAFAKELAQGTRSVESELSFDELMAPTDEAKKISYWIRAVNNEARGLTQWEEEFMESITEQFAGRESLSPRQTQILERIYAEKTS